MARFHGFAPRKGDQQPLGQFVPSGKFGRLFPELKPLTPSKESLEDLGKAMVDPKPNTSDGDNETIPAGFTYLGQFIDHDITFDTTSLQETLVDPLALRNFRTPMLDLDSVYGAGPDVQPYLYELDDPELFLIGQTTESNTGRADELLPVLPNDIPRAKSTLGLIGDPRNDENLIVSQLHLAFLKFHNKIVKEIRSGNIKQESPIRKTPFEEARDLVIWHYQWIVIHDFLKRILDNEQLNLVLAHGPSFYKPSGDPFIPVEFSAAAYRLGHSMIREEYDYNRVFTLSSIDTDSKLTEATLELLFEFTAKSGNSKEPPGLNPDTQPTVPSNWIIDWRRFFNTDAAVQVGFSRKLDPFLVVPLQKVPNLPNPVPIFLAIRNLLRGSSLGLPPGQSIAKFMGFKPLSETEIAQGSDGEIAKKHNFHIETPLWYYILKEAQVQGKGQHLGQVGSRIIAEVFIGLLKADSSSFLARKPEWRPILPAQKPGTFTMVDLLKFVDDVNPIGD